MGKKNEIPKPATANAEAPAPKKKPAKPVQQPVRSVQAPAKAEAPAAAIDGIPAKPAAKKKLAAKAAAKAAPAKTSFTADDVALRAYYIGENRRRHGIHGDEHSDWVEAERQLKAEHKKALAKKAAAPKK